MSKRIDLESELLEEPVSRLEKPVDLKDIIDKVSDFTIRTIDEDEIERMEETDISQVYSMEELEPYCLTDVLEPASDDDDDDPNYDEISKSFPVFRKKMFNVTEDGKVMKLIDHESHDEKVPDEGNIVVYYRYSAYVEFCETPFDCSGLRQKRPVCNTLGICDIIPGLEIALRSMRRGEKAKFLVHPDLAYRESGVPPRIPPQATILYDVQLVDICVDSKVEYVHPKNRTFAENLKLAQSMRKRGNVFKTVEKNVNGAISAYRKGLQILLETSMDNDKDEALRKKEMIHFYCNLAVCYLEKKRYKMVCNMYNDARIDCSPHAEKNPKLLYCSGKALKMLGSFDEALTRLRRALRLKPADESILKELDATSEAQKKHQDEEKRACKRIFGFLNPDDAEKTNEEDEALLQTVGSEFKDAFMQTLDYMDSSDRKTETINANILTYAEKRFINKICKERNFLIRTPKEDTILIIKKSVPH